MRMLIISVLLAVVAAGTLYSRGERDPAVLALGATVGAIIGAVSVFMDRWNTVKIMDDTHKKKEE